MWAEQEQPLRLGKFATGRATLRRTLSHFVEFRPTLSRQARGFQPVETDYAENPLVM
jgi:hypothetical protein